MSLTSDGQQAAGLDVERARLVPASYITGKMPVSGDGVDPGA